MVDDAVPPWKNERTAGLKDTVGRFGSMEDTEALRLTVPVRLLIALIVIFDAADEPCPTVEGEGCVAEIWKSPASTVNKTDTESHGRLPIWI
jgi:hypothetical protein